MHWGVITDEVSQDIEEAARFAVRHGMDEVDIRSVNDMSPFALSRGDYLHISEVCKAHGLRIVCIDAPLFKCSINDRETVAKHISEFARLADIARDIGCRYIRGFDFWNEGASVTQRAAEFAPIVEICEKTGVICAIESDPSVHASTAKALAELLNAIGSPMVQALFDPGNAFWVNERAVPCPDDYGLLRGRIAHIHIKDARVVNGHTEAVCVGTGLMDFPRLLRALRLDGYAGGISLETHYRVSGEITEEQLRLPGGARFTDGAYIASEESTLRLHAFLNDMEKE